MTRRTAIEHAFNGLSFYGNKKTKKYPNGVRIEFLTLSISTLNPLEIETLFEKFINRMNTHCYYSMCSWLAVFVGGQHVHAFWRKPFYMTTQEMGQIWARVVGENSNCKNFTVRGDLTSKEQMIKIVNYFSNQGDHHQEDVIFLESEYWGKIVPRSAIVSSSAPLTDLQKQKKKLLDKSEG